MLARSAQLKPSNKLRLMGNFPTWGMQGTGGGHCNKLLARGCVTPPETSYCAQTQGCCSPRPDPRRPPGISLWACPHPKCHSADGCCVCTGKSWRSQQCSSCPPEPLLHPSTDHTTCNSPAPGLSPHSSTAHNSDRPHRQKATAATHRPKHICVHVRRARAAGCGRCLRLGCHCCAHGVDLDASLPPVNSRLDQVKVAPGDSTQHTHHHNMIGWDHVVQCHWLKLHIHLPRSCCCWCC